jgi:hypothetical protein
VEYRELDEYMANARWQWQMGVLVYHDQRFGHRIVALTQTVGRDGRAYDLGSWRGIGVPEAVHNAALARVDSLFSEHLVSRYGIAQELWSRGEGESSPF